MTSTRPNDDEQANDGSTAVSEDAVREQLDKIVASTVLAPSQRLVRFLRYVTDRALAGRADELKEYSIGLEVFDRDASYDPRIDTIVRSEARRLRSKLKQYYDTVGRFDAVAIDLPKGSYAPAFRMRDLGTEAERVGTVVGHYKIIERLGSGATSIVYKAEDTRLGRNVALKFLAPHLVFEAATKARLVREAQAAATLDHPNICAVHEINEAQEQTFIALSYIEGQSLDNRIAAAPIAVPEAIAIAVQLAEGLREAHRKGVVHRDLKPANVMLDREGVAKIVDFGLAQLAGRSRLTREGITLGTAAYIAPEQVQRQESDERSDIWSLGVVLYEMITGRSPFEGEREEATLYAILHEEPTPISKLRAGVPDALERVVRKALEKWPDRRYQHAAAFLADLKALEVGGVPATATAEAQEKDAVQDRRRPWRRPISVGSALALVAVAALIAIAGIWLVRPGTQSPSAPSYRMTQLTWDSGLTYQPALSADGTLMAYASDRAAEGGLDIWVQQIPYGNPIRLTQDEADDHDPHFSPDGRTITFRSERGGGGVYVVPALGGDERLIAPQGRRPRFSPDGRQIAYWTGESPFSFSASEIYLVRATGGEPRRFQPDLDWVSHPVWSPDGTRILFAGSKDSSFDWWLAPTEGGAAVATRGREGAFGTRANPIPLQWLPDEDRILFAMNRGDSFDLWQTRLSTQESRLIGPPERLTSGPEWHLYSWAAAGRIAFSSVRENLDIWSYPLDPQTHQVTGNPSRLTTSAARDYLPSLSRDGNSMAFVSGRSGSDDIWLKDLESGREQALTATSFSESKPEISPDGSMVAYRAIENGKWSLFAVASQLGVPRRVCDNCFYPWGWSSDATRLLFGIEPAPSAVGVLEMESGNRINVLRHPDSGHGLWSAAFSPDDQHVVFHTNNTVLTRQTFVAPLRGDQPVSQDEWIAVTDGSSLDGEQRWSPDGNAIYLLSERDGFRCVWAQPVDSSTKQPLGEAAEVYHFNRAQLSPLHALPQYVGLSVAHDKFAITLAETTGNIWMMEPSGSR